MKVHLLFRLLFVVTFLTTFSVGAQEPYFLTEKTKGDPRYMIRITEKDTTLYQFGLRYGKFGFYAVLSDEQPLPAGSLQFDSKSKGYFYRLEAEKWKDRQKILFVRQHDSIALPFFRRAAWMQQYEAFNREMDTLFPLNSLDQYDEFWDYRDSAVAFEGIADWMTTKRADLREQTIRVYAPLDSCYRLLTDAVQTTSYDETRKGLEFLCGQNLSYASPGHGYFDETIKWIAIHRPELIFQLEKDLPAQRSAIIWTLAHNKQTRKSLKAFDKHASFTKIVRKKYRNDVIIGIGGATLGLAVDGAVIYGIVWLIRR